MRNGLRNGNGMGFGQMNVFDLFDNLWDEMGRFNDTLINWDTVYTVPSFPPANVYVDKETKDLIFKFAIAGYPKEAVGITFTGDYLDLVLKGGGVEKKETWELTKKGIKDADVNFRYYCPAAKYSRENPEASLKDGILTVIVHAVEEIKPKQIPIL
jgi:HSP20 family molecular chaperone IbpA